jgi:hypothetical protein
MDDMAIPSDITVSEHNLRKPVKSPSLEEKVCGSASIRIYLAHEAMLVLLSHVHITGHRIITVHVIGLNCNCDVSIKCSAQQKSV